MHHSKVYKLDIEQSYSDNLRGDWKTQLINTYAWVVVWYTNPDPQRWKARKATRCQPDILVTHAFRMMFSVSQQVLISAVFVVPFKQTQEEKMA